MAINRGQAQLAQGVIALGIKSLKERSTRADACAAGISAAVNKLQATMKPLPPEPVRQALDLVSTVSAGLQDIRSQRGKPEGSDVKDKVNIILQDVAEVMNKLSTAIE